MAFNATAFLTEFGYLDPTLTHDEGAVETAVATAQEAYGVPVTGEVDAMTERAFVRIPRCGVSDAWRAMEALNRWGPRHLSYAVEATPRGSGLTQELALLEIAAAFQSWSGVCGLTFERIQSTSQCNLLIGVGRGSRAGFDGQSGTLAWAELPPTDGHTRQLTMRFDLDENYVAALTGNGILLENVACHEIGHMLGLNHTNVQGSLMLPTYNPRIPKPTSDDIRRAVERYGPPAAAPVPPTGPVPIPGGDAECHVRIGGESGPVYKGILRRS